MVQSDAFASSAAVKTAFKKENYLFSPTIDFLGLGGGSLIAFVLIFLFFDNETFYPAIAVSALALANIANHPHFAHSYQIFYRDFPKKLRDNSYPKNLRIRYLFSGVIVPILLAGFLAGTFLAGKPRLLGLGATLMFFLVGWHYVKQGYGMAMVDAALKKQFFSGKEKTALMLNAYATWIFAWSFINRVVAERDLLGLKVYVIPVPDLLFYISAWAATATLLWLVFVLSRNALTEGKKYPLNGLLAYALSLYPWMFFRDVSPIYFALVPFFHSVQYMTVVWRYEINASSAKVALREQQKPVWDISKFYITGIALGGLGFWGAPLLLHNIVSYDRMLFGSAAFLFIFWIFINVHHYFMDNVMWRKGNPDVARHLFGAQPRKTV